MKSFHFRLLVGVRTISVFLLLSSVSWKGWSQAKSGGNIDGHDYVDLGLSVKWATCNIGAESPEDYGDYYAWGCVEPRPELVSTFHHYKKKELKRLTEGDRIGDIMGDPLHDAATANWGENWRMPSKSEFHEMAVSTKTKRVKINKVRCLKLTSKYNGNYIILPRAGYYIGKKWFKKDMLAWSTDYWTGTTDIQFRTALSNNGSTIRYFAMPIRPVTK